MIFDVVCIGENTTSERVRGAQNYYTCSLDQLESKGCISRFMDPFFLIPEGVLITRDMYWDDIMDSGGRPFFFGDGLPVMVTKNMWRGRLGSYQCKLHGTGTPLSCAHHTTNTDIDLTDFASRPFLIVSR